LQDVAFSVFQQLPLLRHALFPSGFRLQVNRTAQRYFLRTSPDCVRDSAARSAAHNRVGCQRVTQLSTFPTAPLRTARDSFDVKQLSS
jgi:hypothetical protein